MILAIIFLVIFAACVGVNMYFAISLVKSPMIEIDFAKHFKKCTIFVAGAVISFLVASFGFYQWLNASPDALHIVELVLGEILFIGGLFVAINCFIVHYYGKNIPEKLDKALFRIQLIGFIVSTLSFFIYTNGLAPYLSYPLAYGISFSKGFVSPDNGSPNIAFYALCILSGAVLVYFICDHYMYKEYGKHGTLESTFFVAFPAGIIGARIAYVVGNWSKEFAGQPFWHVFAIWEGGLTILGGAIGGILVGVLFFIWRYKKQMSIWFAIDLVLPTILIAQAIGRWGNFFNCEVHGLVDSVDHWKWLPEIIWRNAQYSSTGLDLRGTEQMYVPLFFIEFVSNLLGFFVLAHVFDKALHKYHEPGDIGCGYIIWYGMTRVLMEPLRSADYQMGDKGYWSWLWSMVYVLVGTLLIVVNHIVRNIIKKKNNTFEVKPYDTKLGSISSLIILVVGGALTGIGAYMMSTNSFETIVKYNGFNVGLIILVIGVSILLTLAISLPILFESFKNTPKEKEIVKENSDENL